MMQKTHIQEELRVKLMHEFSKIQTRNQQFSLRSFAKQLDVNPSSLSEFFNKKRNFSPKMVIKILDNLRVDPKEKEKLIKMNQSSLMGHRLVKRSHLDSDMYFLVSDPIYYSLLCLIELKNFKDDFKWMSKKLKCPISQIKLAIERLERVGLIKILNDGKIVLTTADHLQTSDDIANMSLRLRHLKNLEDAKKALEELPIDKRYFRFETLAINKEKIPDIKKLIQKFHDDLTDLTSIDKNKDEVIEFCMHYFPRSFEGSAKT